MNFDDFTWTTTEYQELNHMVGIFCPCRDSSEELFTASAFNLTNVSPFAAVHCDQARIRKIEAV